MRFTFLLGRLLLPRPPTDISFENPGLWRSLAKSGTSASLVATRTPSCVHTLNDAFPFNPTPIHPKPPTVMSRSLFCQLDPYTFTVRDPHSPICLTRFSPAGGESFPPACFANSASALPPSPFTM